MTTKFQLAKTPCWKCDGKGRIYGFMHVEGGVCFRCGGRGFDYVSKKAAQAFNDALPRKAAKDLQVGDRIRVSGVTRDLRTTFRYWATVTKVGEPKKVGRYGEGVHGTPGYVERDVINMTVVTHSNRYGDQNNGFNPDTMVEMGYGAEDVQRILAELAPRFRKGIEQVEVEETSAGA